jgi:PAS domain S-box-containing protein
MVERVKGITRYGYVLKDSGEFVLLEAISMAFELFDAHRELERSRDLYRSSADLTGDVIVRADAEGRWYFFNREGERVWGVSLDEVYGETFWEYVHPDDRRHTAEAVSYMMESGKPVTGLVNRQRTVFGWRSYEWNGAPIFDSDGSPAGFQATGRDIEERERISRELLLKNHAIAGSANGIVFADTEQRITYANRTALDLWAVPSEDLVLGRPAADFLGEPAELDATLLRVAQGAEESIEITGIRPDGSTLAAELFLSAVHDHDGVFRAFMAVIVDITERKQKEQEIRDLLRRKEQLVREVQHRVKNDMGLLRSLLNLQADRAEPGPARESLEEASDRLLVLSRVYERLHHGSGNRAVEGKELVGQLLNDLESSTLGESVRVSQDIDEIMICDRDSVSIGLIVNELVTNSAKYASRSGAPVHVTVRVKAMPEDGLAISVGDDGPGFSRAVLEGRDYGYGLTVVRELSLQHGGRMRLVNGPGAQVHIEGLLEGRLTLAANGCL